MIQVLSAIFLLVLSINLVFGFNKALVLVQSNASSNNIPNNKIEADVNGINEIQKVPLPVDVHKVAPPFVTAQGVKVIDLDTQTVLYTKNENNRLPIASTTKIMTALIASAHYQPNDILEVKDLSMVTGSNMGLHQGEKLTFRSLLYGLLLNSGNDAAYVLAQNYPGGVVNFLQDMNEKAAELGLKNSHFSNPAGFDDPSHYSSAHDLDKIAELAIEDPFILKVVGTSVSQVSSIDKTKIHNLKNLDILLGQGGFIGIKTGFTPEAKENFVGLVDRDGHKILTVVLGSDDRFGETQKLVNWVYANFEWK
jgi:serine-type D-Ala-D-Ala carboxypeptidase (penicillin-binding protein 5/6)